MLTSPKSRIGSGHQRRFGGTLRRLPSWTCFRVLKSKERVSRHCRRPRRMSAECCAVSTTRVRQRPRGEADGGHHREEVSQLCEPTVQHQRID